jgi:hypothetical protein
MPQPLLDGQVEYGDGTPNTLDQEARDVTAFLAWAAEPHLGERKKMGLSFLFYAPAASGCSEPSFGSCLCLDKAAMFFDIIEGVRAVRVLPPQQGKNRTCIE